MSIRIKILIPMVVVAVVCATTIGLLGVLVVNLFVSDFNNEQLTEAKVLATNLLEQHVEDAARSSAIAAGNDHLIETLSDYLAGGDRQLLVTAAINLMTATDVDFLTIMDASGNVLVRAHEPDNYGDSLANQANVKSAMQGKQYTTTEKGSAVKLSVRSGMPLYDSDGKLIGVASMGYRLDQNGFVDYVKRLTGTEVTVFLGDTRISTTILNDKGERAVDTQAAETISTQVLAGNDYTGKAVVVGQDLLTYYSPIRDAEGVILGMLFVGLDTSAIEARMVQDTWIMVGVVTFLGILSVIVALNISRRIVRPIREMADAAERLAEGDVDVEITVAARDVTRDETTHLAMAFSNMIYANRERARLIEQVAGGDLTGSIQPKSDKDVVGIALQELLEMNNVAFSEMNNVATQVDLASTMIAGGAQSLSSSTMGQATVLNESIKDFAEKGSRQMEQMIEAVKQISDASESIGKVMVVINDIARQTNILALNASVEAARAGQHGVGFASVAEEVRNLAAKSTEAAKNTNSLIANSIEKAKLGAKISTDTAASFADILGGADKTGVIIDGIAKFMTSVSAAAEESAAASEEMSAQATSMAATLSGYKLRGG